MIYRMSLQGSNSYSVRGDINDINFVEKGAIRRV